MLYKTFLFFILYLNINVQAQSKAEKATITSVKDSFIVYDDDTVSYTKISVRVKTDNPIKRDSFKRNFHNVHEYTYRERLKDTLHSYINYKVFTNKDSSYILIDYPGIKTDIVDYVNENEYFKIISMYYTDHNDMKVRNNLDLRKINSYYTKREDIDRFEAYSQDKKLIKFFSNYNLDIVESDSTVEMKYLFYKNKSKKEITSGINVLVLKSDKTKFNNNLLWHSSFFFVINNIRFNTGLIKSITILNSALEETSRYKLENSEKTNLNFAIWNYSN